MALWLSLVLATLSYAAPPRAQGGEFRTNTLNSAIDELLPWAYSASEPLKAVA